VHDLTSLPPQRVPRTGVVAACARFGYLAKGVVFGTVGILAVMTACGFSGGRIVGAEGAVQTLGDNAFGRVILIVIAAGLAAFVVWRIVEALADPDRKGTSLKGLVQRAGYLASAAAYASLAAFTVRHLERGDSADGQNAAEHTRTLMAHDWGIWLVALVGAGFVAVACYQLWRARSAAFRRRWRREAMGPDEERWAVRISRIGIVARAVAFALIGMFLLRAAIHADPEQAEGLSGALRAFLDERWGTLWLGAIGTGFVCYGLYCIANARYRRIRIDV